MDEDDDADRLTVRDTDDDEPCLLMFEDETGSFAMLLEERPKE